MSQLVGYKLIEDATGTVVEQWGGYYNTYPGIPNPLILPNGDQICAAMIGVSYSGYTLQNWMMDDPKFYDDLGVPKPIADCQAVKIKEITSQAENLLSPTDWYVIRASEPNGTVIPDNVLLYRKSVREHSKILGQEVMALTDVAAVIGWEPHDWPVMT